MEYNFRAIEQKWQQQWKENNAYKVDNPVPGQPAKPKFYVLDMFPYPSGAGLHVGHPLGYIASDIFSRYKRLKGYNVLHPMGFDSFGLPAEQYAIETGQHPATTTAKNIQRYHEQLNNIGFSFDWSREVRTSDPGYYKWTQYIFLQLFGSWFNRHTQRAERIETLIALFEQEGNYNHVCPGNNNLKFTAHDWANYDEKSRQDLLMHYRLAFLAYGDVNWCEALGTVLANDEVVNGVSERGGHPVEKKKLHQWYLRITEYADRLLLGLEQVDFSDAMKDMQRNWIGKSQGAEIVFGLKQASLDLTPNPSAKERGVKEHNSDVLKQTTDNTKRPDATSQNQTPDYINSTVEQWKFTINHAKQNRKNPTEAEDILWQELRNQKLGNSNFRRQHPVAGYIPDFVCLEKKLIVDIDGGYHEEKEQFAFDQARSKWLEENGYRLIRFTNDEITSDISSVLTTVGEALSIGEGLDEVVLGNAADDSTDEIKISTAKERTTAGGSSPLQGEAGVRVYTTRPDTIFGVDFMVLAPEHELVEHITTTEQRQEIDQYLHYVKSRSERERMAEVKQITGAFTGAYALNPFDGREIPIWISEYVLAGYGTGAIMAVPCGDQRDYAFAKHFNIPITNIIGDAYNGLEANPTKDAVLQNSGFMDGMVMRDAMAVAIDKLEEIGIGKRQVNYRMRDAGFSRQRYWGEPFPIVYRQGIPTPLPESELPVELPFVETYGPGPEGEGPLANLTDWVKVNASPAYGERHMEVLRETNTMPGYAGSSWYFLRYMDPNNDDLFVDRNVADYWGQVDLYIGGTEHAVGHLLYSRMWTKVLHDLGYIGFDEPFKKLVNQGMIQGSSRLLYRIVPHFTPEQQQILPINENVAFEVHPVFVSKSYRDKIQHDPGAARELFVKASAFSKNNSGILDSLGNALECRLNELHVDVQLVDGVELKVKAFRQSRQEYENAVFVLENGKIVAAVDDFDEVTDQYICGSETEKMSKSKFNVVNPDDIVERFGADTFRMYEMFLGPIDQSKPWDTKGIEGVHRFLRKFWRLFVDENKGLIVTNEQPTAAELKVLHKTIKKIEEDTERFSFNTAVSTFMIAVNELGDLKCHKRAILEPLAILIAPYAPHLAEELYQLLHQTNGEFSLPTSVLNAAFPILQPQYLVEQNKTYPVSINGKVRTNIDLSLDTTQAEVENIVLQNEVVNKWLEGKAPKKIIYVKGKMINIVT